MSALKLLEQLDRLESEATRHGQAERRVHRRTTVRAEAELHPMNRAVTDGGAVAIALRDISRTGVGFVCPQPLALGSIWHLSITYKGHEMTRLGLSVRHCRKVSEGVYLAGGTFCIDTATLLLLGIGRHVLDRMDQHSADDSQRSCPPNDAQFLSPDQF